MTARNKAIPTRFHGYYFRSRLEARWAVVFNEINLDWRYEPEGLESPHGDKWLPDFLLKIQGKSVWVEIKPPGRNDTAWLDRMGEGLSNDEYIWFVSADIPDPIAVQSHNSPSNHFGRLEGKFAMYRGHDDGPGGWDYDFWLCVCDECSAIDIQYTGRSARINCGCAKPDSDKMYSAGHPILLKAYAAARGKRFEHEDRETW